MKTITKIILILTLAILAGGAYKIYTTQKNVHAVLLQELESFLLPDTHNPTDLASLRLSKYWIETRLDPILALPNIVPEILTNSIRDLKRSTDVFKQEYNQNYTADEQEKIENSLFPILFLETLTATEVTRRTFISAPSNQTATDYHESLLKSLSSYQQSLATLKETFSTLDSISVGFLNGLAATSYIDTQLTDLITQTDTQISLAQARFACYQTYRSTCSKLTDLFQTIPIKTHDAEEYQMPDYIRNYSEVYKNRSYPNPESEKDQPLIVNKTPHCLHTETPTVHRLWWPPRYPGVSGDILRTVIVNDFFMRSTKELQEKNGFYSAQYRAGITQDLQDISPYYCMNSEGDIASIRTTYYAHTALTEQTFFTDTEYLQKEIPELSILESKIRNADPYLAIEDAEQYFALVHNVLAQHGEKKLAEELGETVYLQLAELLLTWKAKTAYQAETINLLTYLTASLEYYILPSGKIPISALFISRSYMSSLFLTENRTLIKNSISFIEAEKAFPLKNFGLESYHQEMRDTWSLDKLSTYLETLHENIEQLKADIKINKSNSQ